MRGGAFVVGQASACGGMTPEYQAAKRLREGAASFNMVAVEGVA
jgi:uncharacterized protein (DUF1330 family)